MDECIMPLENHRPLRARQTREARRMLEKEYGDRKVLITDLHDDGDTLLFSVSGFPKSFVAYEDQNPVDVVGNFIREHA